MTPELSFDGRGINGPNEYRDRLATFNASGTWTPEQITKYGNLFAAAPELLAFAKLVAAGNTEISELEAMAQCLIEKAQP